MDDTQFLAGIRAELFTCVVGDVMDTMGLIHQFLPPRIRPVDPDMVIVGRAMPVLEADCATARIGHLDEHRAFGIMFDALDDLKRDEVYVCSGGSDTYAQWGELMSTRAAKLGAAGAVLNGRHRDTRGIRRLGFPTFSFGPYGQDQGVRGRVIDYRCTIEFPNGVRVHPGDIVFADIDGVVIVPRSKEHEIIAAALEKVRGENKVRSAIEDGMSTRDAFEKYGIM